MRTLIAIGLTTIYAACFVFIRAGSKYAPPFAFSGLRTLIAGTALLMLVTSLDRPILPVRRLWPSIVALSLTSTAGAYGAMFLSPGRAGVGIASVLGNLQPFFVIVLAAVVLSEPVSSLNWLTVALGAGGALLIASTAFSDGEEFGISGPALALTSSLGFAVGSILIKRLNPGSSLLALTGWQLVIGSLPLLALSYLLEREDPVDWTIRFTAILLFLALIGTALATAGWYWIIEPENLGRLTIFLYLVPVFGLALSTAVYGGGIEAAEGIGVAFIMSSVGLAAFAVRSDRSLPSQDQASPQ